MKIINIAWGLLKNRKNRIPKIKINSIEVESMIVRDSLIVSIL